MTNAVAIIDLLKSKGGRVAKAALEEIDEAFREGVAGHRPDPLYDTAALARYVFYYSLSLSEAKKIPTDKVSPKWLAFCEEYGRFRSEVDASEAMEGRLAIITDDLIKAFCNLNGRTRGSRISLFYVSILTFVLHLRMSGKLENKTMLFAVPRSDRDLIKDWEELFIDRFTSEDGGKHAVTERSKVDVTFHNATDKVKLLRSYIEHYQSPEDKCAHFVVYRTRRSDPLHLMKSFLAFKPPWADKGGYSKSYNFVHMYVPPTDITSRKISNGKIVALNEGLYCVGGQKDDEAYRDITFNTLKVIALGWGPIKRHERYINGLMMTATGQDEHLLSHAFLRATPADRSDQLRLGLVSLNQLESDLRADFEIEREKITSYFDKSTKVNFPCQTEDSKIKEIVSKIAEATNNDPREDKCWNVPAGYVDKKEKLTRSSISLTLEKEFGDFGSSSSERKFEFWRDLRFGPLLER